MVHHRLIPLDAPSEWRDALKGIKHGFCHTWEHCYGMHLTSGLTTFLYCFEANDVRIVCPIAERRYRQHVDVVKPFGFSGFVGNGDCPEFTRHWRDFARERGYICGYLGVHPLFANKTYLEPNEVFPYNSVYVLDLTQSSEELYADLSHNRRRDLQNWDSIVPSLVLDTPAVKEFFVDQYPEFMLQKNAPSLYRFSRGTLAFLADLENVFIVGVRDNGKLVGAVLQGYTPYAGDGLFHASVAEGHRYSTALIWYAVRHLKSLGVPSLNVGGGLQEDDGLARFKASLGCRKYPLECVKQIYEPQVYRQLCEEGDADPDDLTGYFPAYRRP